MKRITDKDKKELLDMLNKKEELLQKRVKNNYNDARKHLRLAITKDNIAEDVAYLAAKTFCEVYEMADSLDLIENKLLNGEIEQIANGEMTIPEFFEQQLGKRRLRKASDTFFEELQKEMECREKPECVCGNCHPEKLADALRNFGIDIDDVKISVQESFTEDDEDGNPLFQAEVRKVREMADVPNIVYVDAWKGPKCEESDDEFIKTIKETVKDVHPGVAVLVKIVNKKLW